MIRFFLLLVILSAAMIGCGDAENNGSPTTNAPDPTQTSIIPADAPQLPERGFLKAILPIPANGQKIDEAYATASHHAEITPVWAVGIGAADWSDFAEKLSGPAGDLFVDQLIRENGMTPIIHFSFIDKEPGNSELILQIPQAMDEATLSDPEFREAYKEAVLDTVRAVKPLYLSAGNEVNRWYEQYGMTGPNGFEHFITLYEEIYREVKELSPQTRVFCTFAREMVDGLREADLTVLSFFDPQTMDILALTSYPHSVRRDTNGNMLADPFNHPSDIPDDYYARIYDFIDMGDRPFGFSEVAWPSNEAFGGEEAQAEFLTAISGRLTQEMHLHFLGWPWLHDLGPDDTVGLINWDGVPKKAYTLWKQL